MIESKCDASKIDNQCCTADTPCGIGEGDCDSDDQCSGDLICGHDNCGTGFSYWTGSEEYDCCMIDPGIKFITL